MRIDLRWVLGVIVAFGPALVVNVIALCFAWAWGVHGSQPVMVATAFCTILVSVITWGIAAFSDERYFQFPIWLNIGKGDE